MIDPSNPDFQNTPVSPRRPRFAYVPADPQATPHVTIITPFYNTGPVFHETAQSVLQQSFQEWEWLIINDASTDPQALKVLNGYRDRDPRIRVIDHPTNRGPSAARNTGFRVARTDYLVQIDSDDLLEPSAIEKWLWYLLSHPEYGFVKGYSVGFQACQYLWSRGFHEGRAMLEENLVTTMVMIRRHVHHQAGGYDEDNWDGLEDWDFWLRCANAGFWGGMVPEYHDWYRRRPTHTDRWSNFDGGQRCRDFQSKLRRRYPRLWANGFPDIARRGPRALQPVPEALPCSNRLAKDKPRLLMLLPWLTMGEPISSISTC